MTRPPSPAASPRPPHPLAHRALAALAPRIAAVGAGATPTADLYIAHAMRAEIAAGRLPDGTPLARPAAGVLAAGEPADCFVVLRYASPILARAILAARPRRLAVLVDDDVPALIADRSQPLSYRLRQAYAWRSIRALLAAATDVIAPSAPLLERLARFAPGAALHRLDPALIDPLPPLDHHDGRSQTLLLTDTRSHADDAAWAAPAIRAALDARPMLTLLTRLGPDAPAPLVHERATHLPALPWAAFRAQRARMRAHVSLVPRRPTPINAARSATRLLDAAMAGSAGLFSAVPAIERHVGGLPAWTHGEVDWMDAILRLADDPTLCRDVAAHTATIAAEIGNAERQRRFWLELLA